MSFSNASLQTNDLPRPAVSSVPKYDSTGAPAGLYIYGVEQARWQEQLDRDRARTAANGQFDTISDGYLAAAERQSERENSADRGSKLALAGRLEANGNLAAANKLRRDALRTPESTYVTGLL